MSHCPSCGRYVGPYEACPYCGARLRGRISVRAVKVSAVALATVGLAILWFVATRAEVPTVPIDQIGATMNLAYVRIQGRCTRSPTYDPETGHLSFWVSDDTGELYVASYRAETQALIKAGCVPALGDHVTVAGTLRLREDFRSLTINAPEEVSLARADAQACPIGEITPGQMRRRVRVRGQVRDVFQPYAGLTLISLRDETGSVEVALSDDVMALSPVTPTLEIGQSVEVEAAVSQYQGTPQLVPASAADLVVLDDDVPVAEKRFATELSAQEAGRWVALYGTVASVEPFSRGVKLELDDGSGVVTVLLWQDVREGLEGLTPGAEIEVQGELAEYRGELEVIPQLATDVIIVAAPATPNAAPTGTPTVACETHTVSTSLTSSASTVKVGDAITIEVELINEGCGTVGLPLYRLLVESDGREPILEPGEPEPVEHQVGLGPGDSDSAVFTLRGINPGRATVDSSTSFEVHLGHPGPAYWSASGVEEPLVITVGDASTSLSPILSPTPTVDLTPVGSITAGWVGEEVTVEGRIVNASSFSQGFTLTVDDGTGSIVLLMWHDVYDDCWDVAAINRGATVRASGQVGQYEGHFQIEPRSGGDVKAVEVAVADAPRRQIRTISGADEGKRVMVEGEVARTEGLPQAVKVSLRGDRSARPGEIVVFIWRNVLDRIVDNVALGTPGSRVRVVGTVQVYRDNLEIVPALPNDVIVLETP